MQGQTGWRKTYHFVCSFIIMKSVEPTAPTFSQSGIFLYLRLWWKYNFYKGSHYKHKETSLRKVLEVNPSWESCLYVAEAAFSPNVLHTHVWDPSNFCFVLFCFGVFFFQLHRDRGVNGGYQVLSWNESQTQVIHALSTLSFNRLQYINS